jgi:hypothetical protein
LFDDWRKKGTCCPRGFGKSYSLVFFSDDVFTQKHALLGRFCRNGASVHGIEKGPRTALLLFLFCHNQRSIPKNKSVCRFDVITIIVVIYYVSFEGEVIASVPADRLLLESDTEENVDEHMQRALELLCEAKQDWIPSHAATVTAQNAITFFQL